MFLSYDAVFFMVNSDNIIMIVSMIEPQAIMDNREL